MPCTAMNRLSISRRLRTANTLRQHRCLAPAAQQPHSTLPQPLYARCSSTSTTNNSQSHTSTQPSTTASPTRPLSFIERAKRDGAASLIGPFRSSGGYDSLLHAMTVERMDPSGHTTCTLPLSPTPHQPLSLHNSHHRLHGGLHCLLVDVVGTLALLAADGSRGGVSVDIQCQYLDAVELTDTLRCEGRVLKLGGRLGFTEVLLYRQSDGKLVAAGKHIKAM